MTDPLKAFMQANGLATPAFAPDSRYYGSQTLQWTAPDGSTVSYAGRRLLPTPEHLATQGYHTVTTGDRLDNLAATYLEDPGQYWRLCDGNRERQPEALTATVGATLRVTLPQGVPGVTDE